MATSAVASGLFNGDSHNLGISGGFSSPLTAELISDADLIVGWGCALNMWTMRHGRLISAGAKVVQIDVEDSALGANRPITLGVLGDSALTASDALTALALAQPEPAEKYRTEANALAIKQGSRWRDVATEDLSTSTSIDPRVLTRELDSLLPDGADRGRRFGELHGLPQPVPCRAGRVRFLFHPGLPSNRARASTRLSAPHSPSLTGCPSWVPATADS